MLARPSVSAPGSPQRTAYGPQQRSFVPIANDQTPSFDLAWQFSVNNQPVNSGSQRFDRRRVVAMSFLREALKGAKADVVSAGDELLPRLVRAARVARILGVELAAIAALAPYGAYAMSVYRRLTALPLQLLSPAAATAAASANGATATATMAAASQDLSQQQQQQQQAKDFTAALHQVPPGRYGVAVHRQVAYGHASRNTLDVYIPLSCFRSSPSAHAPLQQQSQEQPPQPQGPGPLPVVFFVHGGVWASGETWQYAPMATRLAQAGLVVVVPTYTLYPEALAGTMVEEVSAALSWTFDNVARYGGDPHRVTAAGHSAGGHLVAWALLRRAAAAEATAAAATATTATAMPAPSPDRVVQSARGPAAVAPAVAPASNNETAGNGIGHHHERHRNSKAALPYGRDQQDEQPEGSAVHAGDSRDTAAYLLGGGGASLPGVFHALRAVADVQLHPQPGVDMSYDGDGGGAAAAAAVAAAPTHAEADTRMPALFVGMSAVYDITKHYEFEKSRAVHELSMMKRAVGGPTGFAAASPSVILAKAADGVAAAPPPYDQGSAAAAGHNHFTSYFASFELLGDAIPTRSGLNGLEAAAAGSQAAAAAAADRSPVFNLAAASRLPSFVVMGSCSDHMVPWHEGAELVLQLRRCGVPVRHLLYNHVSHGDFVMAWRPLKAATVIAATAAAAAVSSSSSSSSRSSAAVAAATAPDMHLENLLPCGRDLLRIVTGRVQLTATAAQSPRPVSAASLTGGDGGQISSGSTAPGLGLQVVVGVDEQGVPQGPVRAQAKL